MNQINEINAVQKSFVNDLSICTRWVTQARSQNDDIESNSLMRWADELKCHKSFVEFGFEPSEYNSIGLTKLNYNGLLLDGSEENCKISNTIFKMLNLNTKAVPKWIDLESLEPIFDFYYANGNKLGVLNIDIDGNDYWILKALLEKMKPDLICVEHNASFGLNSISIPYISNFKRHDYHQSGLYHGASIVAFEKLLSTDYSLIENIAGLNLIFASKELLLHSINNYSLSATEAYMEPLLRNKWSSTTSVTQWETIKHLPFINI